MNVNYKKRQQACEKTEVTLIVIYIFNNQQDLEGVVIVPSIINKLIARSTNVAASREYDR